MYQPIGTTKLENPNLTSQLMSTAQYRNFHTLGSHGGEVAWRHLYDWLILLVLCGIEVILNFVITPFHRYINKDMMGDIRYPLKKNTIPVWAVPVYSIVLPILIFIAVYCYKRCVYDLHHGILGVLYASLVTAVITDSIKDGVGRPRPNFFWRCFPDGKEKYDTLGNVVCHGAKKVVNEGYKSFPSGHTSVSFAGLTFLSLYICGKLRVFDGKSYVSKVCLALLPLLAAALVAVSRVDDYWHHWQDVTAGGILGFIMGVICYLQFFPAPYHTECWGPYAYFRALNAFNASGSDKQNKEMETV